MQAYLAELRLFSRDARLYLVAAALLSFAQALPTAFTALYFQAIGFDRAFIGLTQTAFLVGGAVTLPLALWLLDRLGRRRAMLLGLLQNWATWTAAISTPDGTFALAMLVLSGFGNVLYGLTVVPLMAEASSPRERTTLFAAYEGTTTLALFVGSLFAGMVPAFFAGVLMTAPESAEAYRAAMLASFVPRVMGVWPLLRLRHDGVHHDDAAIAPINHSQAKVARFLDPRVLVRLKTPVLLFAIPYALIHFASALILPFYPLFMRANFVASDAAISLTLGLANLLNGIAAVLIAVIVNRFGRVGVMVGGCVLTALLTLGMGGASTLWSVVLCIILRAGISNAIVPVYRAFTIDHAPIAEYTIVSLLLQLSANIGPAIAPPLSGFAQRSVDFTVMLAVCAGLYGVSALLFGWVMRRSTSKG
jgi:MFS family permease